MSQAEPSASYPDQVREHRYAGATLTIPEHAPTIAKQRYAVKDYFHNLSSEPGFDDGDSLSAIDGREQNDMHFQNMIGALTTPVDLYQFDSTAGSLAVHASGCQET